MTITAAHVSPLVALIAGVLILILGVVGLFLPFLQGILFLMIGLALIDLPIKHRAHRSLRQRYRWYRGLSLRYMQFKRRWRQRSCSAGSSCRRSSKAPAAPTRSAPMRSAWSRRRRSWIATATPPAAARRSSASAATRGT